MWRTCNYSWRLPLPGGVVLRSNLMPSSVREVNSGIIEPRYIRPKFGWYLRRGSKPGYPASNPRLLRVVGIDPTLQERLDDMFKEENERRMNRKDIGVAPKTVATVASNRSKMLEHRRRMRGDKSLERAARRKELEVDLYDVKRERLISGDLFKAIRQAADLYGIYEDLFGVDVFFTPCIDLKVAYDVEEDSILPVYRGNIIKPNEAMKTPSVYFESPQGDEGDSLWCLVLTNPDGHLTEDDCEYVHWMVANIRDGADFEGSGLTIVPYLAPFPPHGTGFHRFVFTLYKQERELDLSEYCPKTTDQIILSERSFSTKSFWNKYKSVLTPTGLSFFQSDYDPSLHKFFHNVLNMREPKYEYHFIKPYVRPWGSQFPAGVAKKGFNTFLDKYRDPKDIQEECLRKKLKQVHPLKGDLERQVKYPTAHPPQPWPGGTLEDFKHYGQWRLREIERERMRKGIYKDMEWVEPRRDPSNA